MIPNNLSRASASALISFAFCLSRLRAPAKIVRAARLSKAICGSSHTSTVTIIQCETWKRSYSSDVHTIEELSTKMEACEY